MITFRTFKSAKEYYMGLYHYNDVSEFWVLRTESPRVLRELQCSVIFVLSFKLLGEGALKTAEI